MHLTRFFSSLFAATALLGGAFLQAENWPSWRGPAYNGSTTEESAPSSFSKTKNVKWVIDLPGTGHSTPVVWGDAVFLTSVDEDAGGVVAMRVNAADGKVVWSKKYGDGVSQDNRSTYAGPSPATDGKTVVFFTGSGDLVAYDFDGNEKWKINIQEKYGPFAFGWTFSTSPLFHDGKIYMQVLQRDVPAGGRGFKDKKNESYLLALNPADGSEIFRVIRDSEALMESREAFTSPIPITHD
ncbi:MAG: PQQ-binding-like beta-propeller repeat protein, partial [Verrucomicrobiales bacterium]|nr:PQQ-binding-like beta-propeller repeat protein [Verrucomicrobiales bacterium]